MEIQENVPLAEHTTFKIGGNARYFIEITDADKLGVALDYAQTRSIPFAILAGGSNALISDEGFDGLVIKVTFNNITVDTTNATVTAEAGANLMETIKRACQQGLSGMENMYGIPGSVGGAVRGNAGAFGTEVVDVLKTATAINIKTREPKVFTKDECRFSYRNSFFKQNHDWFVVSAEFALTLAVPQTCIDAANHILTTRNERQIQDIQSAGSFFMNPRVPEDIQKMFQEEQGQSVRDGRVPAGWLIDKSGFRGFQKGTVHTGERSANYVVNDGGAQAQDVRALTEEIKQAVRNRFGVELQEEVTLIGNV